MSRSSYGFAPVAPAVWPVILMVILLPILIIVVVSVMKTNGLGKVNWVPSNLSKMDSLIPKLSQWNMERINSLFKLAKVIWRKH